MDAREIFFMNFLRCGGRTSHMVHEEVLDHGSWDHGAHRTSTHVDDRAHTQPFTSRSPSEAEDVKNGHVQYVCMILPAVQPCTGTVS